jgi:acetylornithine deacetylase/succinyl-diaminopimelate desuccinylase-like protein
MTLDAVTDFIHANRDRYVRELTEYLAIPSISALPDHAADVARCAEWTAAELKRVGAERGDTGAGVGALRPARVAAVAHAEET